MAFHWRTFHSVTTGKNGRRAAIHEKVLSFKVEYQVTLNEALKALGMAEAFSVDQADFS